MPVPTKKQLREFHSQMTRIRMVEEKLMEVFSSGEIPGFLHVCIGQEAVPVAVCSHLTETDYMATTHRGHGHALAKGIDLKRFMAELFGRRNGPCRGRSGSMHLADASRGVIGANGIVGGGIPIAVGAAFAAKYKKTGQATVCFFGEGATGEGAFHESLNLAALLRLPIVFVCENNRWAEFTPQTVHVPVRQVADRASAYGIPAKTVANNFLEIHAVAAEMVTRVREGLGPSLLEVQSARWHGHYVGDAQKYRPSEDIEAARAADCLADFEQMLLTKKILDPTAIQRTRTSIQSEIDAAVEFARNSPKPEPSELMEGLWV
jgi:pyruvate dehydrogenase E1 component alpha subunit